MTQPFAAAMVTCKRCGQKASSKLELDLHTCREPKRAVCIHCEMTFSTTRSRDEHVREQHLPPERTYVCPFCCAIYDSRRTLNIHWKNSRTCPGGVVPLDFFKPDGAYNRRRADGHRPRRWVLHGRGLDPILGVPNRRTVDCTNDGSCDDKNDSVDGEGPTCSAFTGCAGFDGRLGAPRKGQATRGSRGRSRVVRNRSCKHARSRSPIYYRDCDADCVGA